MKKQSGTVNQ